LTCLKGRVKTSILMSNRLAKEKSFKTLSMAMDIGLDVEFKRFLISASV